MKSDKRTEYVTRNTILKLLSDDEIARISTAETKEHLIDGDEYVDLQEPDQGILKAEGASATPIGRVLPRKAVLEKTWREIEALLSAHRIEGLRPHTS